MVLPAYPVIRSTRPARSVVANLVPSGPTGLPSPPGPVWSTPSVLPVGSLGPVLFSTVLSSQRSVRHVFSVIRQMTDTRARPALTSLTLLTLRARPSRSPFNLPSRSPVARQPITLRSPFAPLHCCLVGMLLARLLSAPALDHCGPRYRWYRTGRYRASSGPGIGRTSGVYMCPCGH